MNWAWIASDNTRVSRETAPDMDGCHRGENRVSVLIAAFSCQRLGAKAVSGDRIRNHFITPAFGTEQRDETHGSEWPSDVVLGTDEQKKSSVSRETETRFLAIRIVFPANVLPSVVDSRLMDTSDTRQQRVDRHR